MLLPTVGLVFIRVKTTPNSPRRSVQVVESVRTADAVRQRIVRHMGIALDADEEAKLRVMADELVARESAARLNQDSLVKSAEVGTTHPFAW